jgi:hypothetical protein
MPQLVKVYLHFEWNFTIHGEIKKYLPLTFGIPFSLSIKMTLLHSLVKWRNLNEDTVHSKYPGFPHHQEKEFRNYQQHQ